MIGAIGVFTIGHSNHPIDRFLDLLKRNSVEVVADVRSHPHSRYSPQFNRLALEEALRAVGVRYVYLGRELGGRPANAAFYDEQGHVLFDQLTQSSEFQAGIERLQKGLADF